MAYEKSKPARNWGKIPIKTKGFNLTNAGAFEQHDGKMPSPVGILLKAVLRLTS